MSAAPASTWSPQSPALAVATSLLRELAMSYLHEYTNKRDRKTLRTDI